MHIEFVETAVLDADQRRAVLELCRVAYDADLTTYLADIGPGLHACARPSRSPSTPALGRVAAGDVL